MRRALLAAALCIPAYAQVLVNGAGATFPYPIYSQWFDEFHRTYPKALINYQPVGSGAGIRQLRAGVIDLGASDMPVSDADGGSGLLHFPSVIGAVVPIYNLPRISRELDFTPEMLADIFLGRITRWEDARLAALGGKERLPAGDIAVVHRSDGSGTTYILSDYLSKTSAEWRSTIGKGASLRWPAGIGAKGNEGVAGMVKQTPFSIGYVELVYAAQNRIAYGRVRNAAGRFVKAGVSTVRAAADSAEAMPDDFLISIANAAGKDSYPIASYTWLLAPVHFENPAKKRIVVECLRLMVQHGQNSAETLGYAPLPSAVAARVLKATDRIN